MQKMSNPKLTAKLFIETENEQHRVTLRAYDEALKAIAQTKKNDITCEDLIFAPPFDVAYNKYHVITNVAHN